MQLNSQRFKKHYNSDWQHCSN